MACVFIKEGIRRNEDKYPPSSTKHKNNRSLGRRSAWQLIFAFSPPIPEKLAELKAEGRSEEESP